jgi:ankyrin repeat protein
MRRSALSVLGVVALVCAGAGARHALQAQGGTPARRIDFVRDVQPILKKHCYECHGPERQSNGLRLDRRHAAFRGGTISVINPGSASSSKLYLRLLGRFGEQMPKDDTLTAAEIETIKLWLDQGAEWPDAVAGDPPPITIDPSAAAAIETLRAGDLDGFKAALVRTPAVANRPGLGGTTPLMYAALYADASTLERLVDSGADPNLRNEEGVTALMLAVDDLKKVRVLVEHGANVNAKSADARTPLLIAAGRRGSLTVVSYLLARGAKADVKAPWTGVDNAISPLSEAARNGDVAMIRLLIRHGASAEHAGGLPLAMALRSHCNDCFEVLAANAPKERLSAVMAGGAPPLGPALATVPLLRRGADPNVQHPSGLSMLMLTAASDEMPLDAVRELLARGADVNAPGPGGITALALARRHGDTPMVDLLLNVGARDAAGPSSAPEPQPAPALSPAMAVARSLPLLQRADSTFMRKSGCVSCHNNAITAVTIALARERGVQIDQTVADAQRRKIGEYLHDWRDRALQGHAIPGESDTMAYILLGLAAEKHQPDAATDAIARLIRLQQEPNGSWAPFAHRPPIEASEIQATAIGIRALQVYGPAAERGLNAAAVARATSWLRDATPRSTEDRALQLLGFAWTNTEAAQVARAAQALLSEQRADGGWAQIPSLASDAYATGEALVALLRSGTRTSADPAVMKGVAYLLRTQFADGSWLVRTRAVPLQPYMDADFPHGRDQFISTAATNWATQALLLSASRSRATTPSQ